MSDELRAAAERVRESLKSQVPWEHAVYERTDGRSPMMKWQYDCYDLAKAHLAEHPADDEVPIDEAFLRSVGGKSHGTATIWFESACAGPVYELGICLEGGCDGCSIRQVMESGLVLAVNILMPLVRGEFRRTAQALGVELKSPTP